MLIPAYNEAENLAAVLPRIPEEVEGRRLQAILIDDGSSDGTAEVAREAGAIAITHPFNRGGGAALRSGYAVATTSAPLRTRLVAANASWMWIRCAS